MDGGSGLFEKVLSLLTEIQKNREVYISLVPPFELSFEVDRETLRKRLEEYEIEEEDYKKMLARIENLAIASLEGQEEGYIDGYIERQELEEDEAEKKREELQEQLVKVQDVFLTRRLKQRYALKASSKAPSFHSIDWDIKLKVKDAKRDDIRFPYATCRIKYQREFTADPFALLGGRPFDTIQLNFSYDEVEYLIRVFGVIRQNLEEVEKGV